MTKRRVTSRSYGPNGQVTRRGLSFIQRNFTKFNACVNVGALVIHWLDREPHKSMGVVGWIQSCHIDPQPMYMSIEGSMVGTKGVDGYPWIEPLVGCNREATNAKVVRIRPSDLNSYHQRCCHFSRAPLVSLDYQLIPPLLVASHPQVIASLQPDIAASWCRFGAISLQGLVHGDSRICTAQPQPTSNNHGTDAQRNTNQTISPPIISQ